MKIKIENERAFPVHDDINALYVKKIDNIVKYIDSINKFHMIRGIYKLASYDGNFNNMYKFNIKGECVCGLKFDVPFFVKTFFCPVCFKELKFNDTDIEDMILKEIRYRAMSNIFF